MKQLELETPESSTHSPKNALVINFSHVDPSPIQKTLERLGFPCDVLGSDKKTDDYIRSLNGCHVAAFCLDNVRGRALSLLARIYEETSHPACFAFAPAESSADDLKWLTQHCGFLDAIPLPLHATLIERKLARMVNWISQTPWPVEAERHFQKLIDSKSYPSAFHMAACALRFHPPSAFSLSRLAEVKWTEGDLEQAEKWALDALGHDRFNVLSLNIITQVRMKKGLTEDALEITEGIIRNKAELKKKIKKIVSSAIESRRKGRWEDAISSYTYAQTLWPDSPFSFAIHYNMALAYHAGGHMEKAIEACKQCSLVAPMGFEKHTLLWDAIIEAKEDLSKKASKNSNLGHKKPPHRLRGRHKEPLVEVSLASDASADEPRGVKNQEKKHRGM